MGQYYHRARRENRKPAGPREAAKTKSDTPFPNPLDHLMAQQGFEMVRYADDFVILCRSPEEAARALAVVQEWTAEAGLKLHPEKTKIVDATKPSFDFLGYRFERGRRYPRPKSLQKLKDAIRAKTKRTSGESLTKIINDDQPEAAGLV